MNQGRARTREPDRDQAVAIIAAFIDEDTDTPVDDEERRRLEVFVRSELTRLRADVIASALRNTRQAGRLPYSTHLRKEIDRLTRRGSSEAPTTDSPGKARGRRPVQPPRYDLATYLEGAQG